MARASYLEENSGATFGIKRKVEKITAARTLTNDDSGKIFMCDSAGGAYQITLPTASTGEETPTGDITIAAGSAIISLVAKDAGGDAAVSTAGTQVSNVILDTTAEKGDYVELMFVAGEYVGSSMSGINNGIQTS